LLTLREKSAARSAAGTIAAVCLLGILGSLIGSGCNQILGNEAPESSGSGGAASGGAASGGFGGDGPGGMGGEGGTLTRLDGPCDLSGDRTCDAVDIKLTLVCSKGSWVSSGSCSTTENCVPSTGVCADIVPECQGLEEGARVCSAADEVAICGPNLVSREVTETCSGRCRVTAAGAACVPAKCGDGKEQAGETCDDGDQDNEDGCTELCLPPYCGDGFDQVGEGCDDGGESATCDEDCTPAICGDERTNETAEEECDDGDVDNQDDCTQICRPPFCGDGFEQSGESCDDEGESAACDDDCTAVSCGDGLTNETAGETCDDSGDSAACDDDCSVATCGDAHLNAAAGEVCESAEPGTSPESDACDENCTMAECGDGTVNQFFTVNRPGNDDGGETCDSGSDDDTADCDDDCSIPRCGDGHQNIQAGEACDETYLSSGPPPNTETCDSDCTLPACGDGLQNFEFLIRLTICPGGSNCSSPLSEACDPGTGTEAGDAQRALADSDFCDLDCSSARCGDNHVNAPFGEECDETYLVAGTPESTATCDEDCTFPECGDGYENDFLEECDDGNTDSGDGCDSNCLVE